MDPTEEHLFRVRFYIAEHGYKTTFDKFRVTKRTPKGYWIVDEFFNKRWVSDFHMKRYAYPTRTQALISFHRRKELHVKHARRRLKDAEAALAAAKELLLRPSAEMDGLDEVRPTVINLFGRTR